MPAIDRSLYACRYARLKLGLLDPPEGNPYAQIPASAANSAENRALAIRTAREGIVLLTNPRKTLPLAAAAFAGAGELAVVGPNSDLIAYGNYAGHNDNNTTPVQGLRRVVPNLVWAKGCSIATNNTSGFPEAMAAAKKAKVRLPASYLLLASCLLAACCLLLACCYLLLATCYLLRSDGQHV